MAEQKLQVIIDLKDKASGKLDKFDKNLGKSSKAIAAVGAAAAAAAIVIAAAFVASVKKAAEFEKQMSDVSTLLGVGNKVTDEFVDGIKDLIKTMPVDPDELGASAYSIVSAGITETADTLMVLEAATKLGVAGLGTTEEATSLLTTAMNAFGFEASEAGDVAEILFTSVRAGKTTIADLDQSFGKMAGNASAANISLEDVQAATSAITTVTGKTSEAQNALAQVFLELTKVGGALDKNLRDQGGSLEELQASVGEEGLVGGMEALRDKLGLTDTQFKNLFSSAEGGTAVFQLLTSANENVKQNFLDMTDSSFELESAFLKQNETTTAQFQLLKNNLSVIMIELGTAVLPTLIKAVKGFTKWLKDNEGTIKKVIEVVAFLAETSMAFLVQMFESGSLAIDAVVGLFQSMMDIMKILGNGIKTLISSQLDPFIRAFDAVRNAVQLVINAILKLKEISGGVITGLLGKFGGGKAAGGMVQQGKTFMVGEQGPELFTPGQTGNIIPNNKLGGGMSLTVIVNGDVTGQDLIDRVGEALTQKVQLSTNII